MTRSLSLCRLTEPQMATNLDLQQQLNQLLVEQNKLLEASAKLAKDQVTLTTQLVTAMQRVNYKEVTRDIEDVNKAVSNSTEKSKTLGATNQDVFDKMNAALKEAAEKEDAAGKGLDEMVKKAKKFATAASAIDGFVQGLRFTGNMLHTVGGAVTGLVGSLGHLAASIISIPFKMLSGLIHMSDSGDGGGNELQQALEDIRKEFGSLRTTSGAAIVSMARSMKGELAETGLNVTRIFGNLAERLKVLQEYAHNLGPLFAALAPQFMKNAEAIGAYYKGLGLTEEAQKAVAARSFALGQDVTESLREITNYSHQLSKAFNGAAGSAKEISRDMGTLMADFRHFGGISTKEIGQAVVYFRRLGVEVSKVLGVIERYDNFEDAANGAAQLSQAFGLNVDALQMMKAQNPAERVEMLRKSFFAAGRSVENMTRQERALLAQQSGLDDSALDLVFSMKNQGMTYDQVTKKADAAKKSQMTQTQAMKALADSIERLVRSGGSTGSGGFFDRFIQGFTVGIQRSGEFRRIMRELRIDLRTAYVEGIKVGRAFVDMFPGVKDVFKGIADLFEPRRFRAMFHKVTESFKDFFKDMTDNPRTALPKLVDRLKKEFFSWFQGNSQNGQRILDGFKKFFIALSNIAGGLLKTAMSGLRDGIKTISDLITGRKSLGGASQAKGTLGFMGQLLTPIIGAIKEAGPDLWKAVKELFSAVWAKAEPWLQQNFLKILGVLTGPALLGMAGRAIATSIAGAFTQGLFSFVSGGGVSKAIESVRSLFGRQISQASESLTKAPRTSASAGVGSAVSGVVEGAEQAAKAASESKVNWGKAMAKMAAISLFVVVGMAGILYAIFRFAKAMQENRLTLTSIAGASMAMVTTATAMLAIAGSVKLLSAINLNPAMAGKIVVGLGIIGVVGTAMAAGAYALIQTFGGVEAAKIAKTVAVMGATGTFFLAAAGVVAIAGAIGTIALGTGGIGAAVIATGLATLAITIEAMTIQGTKVMRAIDQFRPGPGFVEKARVFVEVMKGVGTFALSVAQMTAATRPGILDFIRGAGAEEQRATLRQVENTISTLGNQIVRILDSIRTNIRQLSGSEQELKSAQIIGDLLSGVGDLANALKTPSETLQSPGFLAALQGDTVARRIGLMTDYVNEVGNQLRLFTQTVVTMVMQNAGMNISEAQAKAIQLIPPLLSAVGDLANAIRPSPELLREMNKGAQFHGVVQHLSSFIRTTMGTIVTSNLFTNLGTLLTTIVNSVQGLTDQQTKSLQSISPAITAAFTVVSTLGSVIAQVAGSTRSTANPADAATVSSMVQLVNTFFQRMQADLPALVTGMRNAFAGINASEADRLSKGMDGVQKLFSAISGIPQLIKGFHIQTDVLDGFADISYTMRLFEIFLKGGSVDGKAFVGMIPTLQSLVPQLVTMVGSIGNAGEFNSKINAIKTIFEVLADIPSLIKGLQTLTTGNSTVVPATVMDAPLMSLNNILQSLASSGTSNGPNPLIGGRLSVLLRGVSGITNAQKALLTGLVNSVMEVGNSLQSLAGNRVPDNSAGITEAMQNVNNSLYAFATQLINGPGSFISNLVSIRPLVENMVAEIQQVQFERISRVVTGMVTQVNQLSTTIRGIQPIEIEQSLQKLGDSLGLGSDGNYTIQNRNFTINLTVAVRLDNNGLDALELSMLRRVGPHPTRITHGPLER